MMRFWADNGISWTICKQSATWSRQITTPTPHHSIFIGRMLFLTPNGQYQSTEGNYTTYNTRTSMRPGLGWRRQYTSTGSCYVHVVDLWARPSSGAAAHLHSTTHTIASDVSLIIISQVTSHRTAYPRINVKPHSQFTRHEMN